MPPQDEEKRPQARDAAPQVTDDTTDDNVEVIDDTTDDNVEVIDEDTADEDAKTTKSKKKFKIGGAGGEFLESHFGSNTKKMAAYVKELEEVCTKFSGLERFVYHEEFKIGCSLVTERHTKAKAENFVKNLSTQLIDLANTEDTEFLNRIKFSDPVSITLSETRRRYFTHIKASEEDLRQFNKWVEKRKPLGDNFPKKTYTVRGEGFNVLSNHINKKLKNDNEAKEAAVTFLGNLRERFKDFERPKTNFYRGNKRDLLEKPEYMFRNFGRFGFNEPAGNGYSLISRNNRENYITELREALKNPACTFKHKQEIEFSTPVNCRLQKYQYYLIHLVAPGTENAPSANIVDAFKAWIEENEKEWKNNLNEVEKKDKPLANGKGVEKLQQDLEDSKADKKRSAVAILLDLEKNFKKCKRDRLLERFVYVSELENCYSLVPSSSKETTVRWFKNVKTRLNTNFKKFFDFDAPIFVQVKNKKYLLIRLKLSAEAIKAKKTLKMIAQEFDKNKAEWGRAMEVSTKTCKKVTETVNDDEEINTDTTENDNADSTSDESPLTVKRTIKIDSDSDDDDTPLASYVKKTRVEEQDSKLMPPASISSSSSSLSSSVALAGTTNNNSSDHLDRKHSGKRKTPIETDCDTEDDKRDERSEKDEKAGRDEGGEKDSSHRDKKRKTASTSASIQEFLISVGTTPVVIPRAASPTSASVGALTLVTPRVASPTPVPASVPVALTSSLPPAVAAPAIERIKPEPTSTNSDFTAAAEGDARSFDPFALLTRAGGSTAVAIAALTKVKNKELVEIEHEEKIHQEKTAKKSELLKQQLIRLKEEVFLEENSRSRITFNVFSPSQPSSSSSSTTTVQSNLVRGNNNSL